jgi:hypothetical protein
MWIHMRNLTLVFMALGLLAAVPARAQSGSFVVAQNGKPVGTASYSFIATPEGYNSTAMVSIKMQGLDYAISKTERLSSSNQLNHVLLSAIVNTAAVTVTGVPDSAQLLLNISANGRSSTTRLDSHPGAVFLPDFDPGALETMLALAVARNNRDLWAILPKNAGSIASITLATFADEKGTLNGNPIPVHHLIATIAGDQIEIFSGPENQLLQAEYPVGAFALVRKGFVLTPPAKPVAPPPQPPPQSQQPPSQ